MYRKNILLVITAMLLAGCGGTGNKSGFTATPEFATATLPATVTPQAVQTSTLPAPAPIEIAATKNLSPSEGTTTTQVNVRAETSTASALLGMIGSFVKVQVIGRDASASWYQIIYAESEAGKGWVRAEYVQVNAPAEIPLVVTTSGSGAAVSGLVIQKINVRNGPGTEHELLGVLNPNDVVFISGKDSSGAWMLIEFASAPDGKGWVTAEFLQTGNVESVPIIGAATEAVPPPTVEPAMPAATVKTAMQDGDSMQAPLAVAIFSAAGSRALQVRGDVSAPDGDAEDWVQFTTHGESVAIQTICSSDTLRVELWKNGSPANDVPLSCGSKTFVDVTPNSNYFLRLSAGNAGEPEYISYILSVNDVH